MTVLIIILAVFALLLLLPLKARIKYDGALSVFAGVGAAFVKVYPSRKKQGKKQEKSQKNPKKTALKNLSLDEKISLSKVAFSAVKNIIKVIKIKPLILKLDISGTDAASAALNYGKVCAAASALYPTVEKSKPDIEINVNYSGKSTVFADITLKAITAVLIFTVLKALFAVIKVLNKSKGGKNNEQHK